MLVSEIELTHLIVIDGLDGSGKSTQALLLADSLAKKRRTVLLRRHPTDDCSFGRQARKFLQSSGKNAQFCAAFFYMCDVLRSVAVYSWRKLDYIIFVRYLMGTAYLPHSIYKIAYRFFALVVPKSNLMFFLDVKPSEAYSRSVLRGEPLEMFETTEKLEKVRKKALTLAREDNWIIINANTTIEKIQREVWQRVLQEVKDAELETYTIT